jgi:DNA end-binding protein Ku
MPRSIWKGAISFGLVHVPVALYPASSASGIDFDWLDKRSLDPVGYKRVNKRTGKEVDMQHIVKGVKVDSGEYVVLSEDEIKAAYPKTTQTIEIEAFVKPTAVPFTLLDTPYYLEPVGKGQKVYALLREAMLEAGVVGIARVVMHTKEHLAALIAAGPALMLDTLRWASDIRPWTDLQLPAEGRKASGLKDSELKMATELIASMRSDWKPERYADTFSQAVHHLIKQRVAAGKTHEVQAFEADDVAAPSNVVDLTELLARSLKDRKPAAKAAARPAARKGAARQRA